MKVVCYTTLVGDYDELRSPKYVSPNWEYVCFTDQPITQAGIWQIQPLKKIFAGHPTLTSRWHKTHPHRLFPAVEFSVYLDANLQITGRHLESRCQTFIKESVLIALPPHPDRTCAYDEMTKCIQTNRDRVQKIKKVEKHLCAEGFPKQQGLYENNLVFRAHHHPQITRLNTDWWTFLHDYSHRDQLTLTFLLWKLEIAAECVVPVGDTLRKFRGYKYHLHKHLPPRKKYQRAGIRILSAVILVPSWRRAVRNFLNRKLIRKGQLSPEKGCFKNPEYSVN